MILKNMFFFKKKLKFQNKMELDIRQKINNRKYN